MKTYQVLQTYFPDENNGVMKELNLFQENII